MTGAAPSTSPVSTRWRATNWQMAPSWRAYLGSQPYGRGEERARISEREPRGQRFGGASPPERPPRPRRCLRVRSAGRRRCARRHPRPPEPRRWGRGRRARRGRARCRDGDLQPARTPAAGPDVELDAQAAKRGRRRVRRRISGGSRRSSVGKPAGRSGDGMTTEALAPAAAEPAIAPGGGAEIVLPQVIRRRGAVGGGAVPGVLRGRIANARTRAECGRAAGQFLGWCEARGFRLRDSLLAPRGRLHPDAPGSVPGSVPTVKQQRGHPLIGLVQLVASVITALRFISAAGLATTTRGGRGQRTGEVNHAP